MKYPLCRHIRTNGRRCQSPSLTGNIWCFFHQRLHRPSHTRTRRDIAIPAPGDRQAIQTALATVIDSLATRRIETRRATALLYALQLAGSVIPSPAPRPARTSRKHGRKAEGTMNLPSCAQSRATLLPIRENQP